MKESKIESASREAIRDSFAPAIVRVVGPTIEGDLTTPAIVEAARSMDAEAPLMCSGVSKLLTGAAVLAAVQRGFLSLDAPIMPIVPQTIRDGLLTHPGLDDLTVRQALGHRTGFPDAFSEGRRPLAQRFADDDFAYTLDELVHWTTAMKPVKGSKAHRSDLNTHLLGLALATVCDTDYEEALRELVLDPLEMERTRLMRDADPVPPLSARSMVIYRPRFVRSSGAAGGIISTAADLDRFLRGLFGRELIDGEYLDSLPSPVKLDPPLEGLKAGAGTLSRGSGGKRGIIGGSGATGSFAFWNPAAETTIVGSLSVLGSEAEALKLVRRIVKLL